MPQRDAAATRQRILDAAVAEFAERGAAGGRVDRIAQAAGANVRMIYAYFDGKDGLFDAALAAALTAMAEAVPPRADDLPRWAGELFDHHRQDPSALRISLWAQLERPASASEPLEAYLAKTAVAPVDLLVQLYALAQAWFLSPEGLLRADGSDPTSEERIAAHRANLVEAARRLVG
ncbi:MAG: TetR family transcriptional regulator [Microbacteriaceae bacterium]